MADKRAYFKLDVGYLTNPKVAATFIDSPTAVLLHIGSIAYSAQHLTDGIIPMKLVARLSGVGADDIDILLSHGLWVDVGGGRAEIHDYLEHQRPASEVKRAADKARKAANARWNPEDDAPSNAPSMPDALRSASESPMPREREERERNVADATHPRPEVEELCQTLADLIEGNGSLRPNITKAWRDSARLMLDRDKRDPKEAGRLIRWSQANDFWRPNIRSMPKFREKYDTLRLQAGRDAEPTQTGFYGMSVEELVAKRGF